MLAVWMNRNPLAITHEDVHIFCASISRTIKSNVLIAADAIVSMYLLEAEPPNKINSYSFRVSYTKWPRLRLRFDCYVRNFKCIYRGKLLKLKNRIKNPHISNKNIYTKKYAYLTLSKEGTLKTVKRTVDLMNSATYFFHKTWVHQPFLKVSILFQNHCACDNEISSCLSQNEWKSIYILHFD